LQKSVFYTALGAVIGAEDGTESTYVGGLKYFGGMMEKIPTEFRDLLADETKAFAFLATIMRDGTPQLTPVWFNTDGDHILINTAKGRVKDLNMRARPKVAVVIPDPENPYRYLQIRGRVTEFTEAGANEHFDSVARAYIGKPFDYPTDQIRVIYKILPEYIDAHK
jgi:PPOX class probable F420-dependent enzyme